MADDAGMGENELGDDDDDSPDVGKFKRLIPSRKTVWMTIRRILSRRRVGFALGITLLGWAIALLLDGTYAVSLGASIFFAAIMIDELRTIPSRGNVRTVEIGDIAVEEQLIHAVLVAFPVFITGILADIRILFSVLPLFLLLAIYKGRLLPTGWPYQRLKDVPGIGSGMVAFGTSFFVLSSVLFYNQTASGIGMLVLMVALTIRFFTGFTVGDIGAEADREGIFVEQGPPINLPERIGSPRTKKLLLGLNVAAVLLFGALIALQVLGMLAAYPVIAYLFSFVFLYVASRGNSAKMARYYRITDTYVFFLLTAVGWAAFRYSGA